MNDGQSITPAELTLPPSIVSKADLSRLMNELERVDNDLTTNSVRAKVGRQDAGLPPMSDQLTAFLQQNSLELTDSNERTKLIGRLRALKDSVPIIHMTFAVEADPESLGQIALWLRQTVHPLAVIAVGLQPGLVAGAYIRTSNKVFDLSLRGALKSGRHILNEELEALRGRA